MTDSTLIFNETDCIGRVSAVDTSRVLIDVDDPNLLTRIGVGNLIAVKGSTEQEYLIGLTERITRALREEMIEEEEDDIDEVPLSSVPDDLIRIVLVGTFRTVDGDRSNVFKRGADSSPQIDRECYFIQGGNLQRFMGLLGASIDEKKQFVLGRYIVDRSAVAIANGDKFFQRHASILGSTGSGKSWTVALILERANQLSYPNIVVLDMHGEYTPLTKKESGFATGFKIAGPGDLDKPSQNIIFLPYWLLNREEMLSMLLDRTDQNAPNQASRFTLHVRELKEDTLKTEGKLEVCKTFTVDSPIPYSSAELVTRLNDDNTRKVSRGV